MTAPDSVDALVADWQRADASLDVRTVEIVQRIRRVNQHIERTTDEHFAARGLSGPAFAVLSVLMRQRGQAGVRQGRLAALLRLTPGTVSLRIDQLEQAGLVRRTPDPGDRRGTVVILTDDGRHRFREVADDHLALQDRQLAALTADERATLAGLLRKLLVSYEPRPEHCPTRRLGMALSPAHEVLALQHRLGIAERPGLLVTHVAAGSPAATAGLGEGDLIVGVAGHAVRSVVDLVAALEHAPAATITVGRGDVDVDVTLPPQALPTRHDAGGSAT